MTAQILNRAMEIIDQAEADACFAELVKEIMEKEPIKEPNRSRAEAVARHALGYYAGYYSDETRARVERLFRCQHPYFGAIAERPTPTTEEAFAMGERLTQKRLN